jgi:hypothetical protein
MQLPENPTAPVIDPKRLTVLIYGPPKIGKSTFCSQSDGAIFLATEPGLNSLNVHQIPIDSWAKLLEALSELAKGGHKFKTVVLDTIDVAYRMCSEHVLGEQHVKHESDLGYGKGWAMVKAEFNRVLVKLAHLPYGLILVSHAQDKEVVGRTGTKTKTVPNLPDKAREILLGLVDVILCCAVEETTIDGKQGHRRVMYSKPSLNYEAGDRTGKLPEIIGLSYAEFAGAFAGTPEPSAEKPQPIKKGKVNATPVS